jgi:Ran GTPase-activating protein (RanGAP) involved in mRNA processing and transport
MDRSRRSTRCLRHRLSHANLTLKLAPSLFSCLQDIIGRAPGKLPKEWRDAVLAIINRVREDHIPLLDAISVFPLALQSSHLSFQEYFAARTIASFGRAVLRASEIVLPHVFKAGNYELVPWQLSDWWTNTLKLGEEIGNEFSEGLLKAADISGLTKLELRAQLGDINERWVPGSRRFAVFSCLALLMKAVPYFDLRDNRISAEEVWLFVDGLEAACAVDKPLTSINLSGNPIGAAGAERLGVALTKLLADKLTKLDLTGIQMCDVDEFGRPKHVGAAWAKQGVVAVATAVRTCNVLTEVSLSNNGLGTEGGIILLKGLSDFKKGGLSLTKLNLSRNTFGAKACALLFKALSACKKMVELNLSGCDLNAECGVMVARAIGMCLKLKELDLSDNQLCRGAHKRQSTGDSSESSHPEMHATGNELDEGGYSEFLWTSEAIAAIGKELAGMPWVVTVSLSNNCLCAIAKVYMDSEWLLRGTYTSKAFDALIEVFRPSKRTSGLTVITDGNLARKEDQQSLMSALVHVPSEEPEQSRSQLEIDMDLEIEALDAVDTPQPAAKYESAPTVLSPAEKVPSRTSSPLATVLTKSNEVATAEGSGEVVDTGSIVNDIAEATPEQGASPELAEPAPPSIEDEAEASAHAAVDPGAAETAVGATEAASPELSTPAEAVDSGEGQGSEDDKGAAKNKSASSSRKGAGKNNSSRDKKDGKLASNRDKKAKGDAAPTTEVAAVEEVEAQAEEKLMPMETVSVLKVRAECDPKSDLVVNNLPKGTILFVIKRETMEDKSVRGLVQMVDLKEPLGWMTVTKADGSSPLVPSSKKFEANVLPSQSASELPKPMQTSAMFKVRKTQDPESDVVQSNLPKASLVYVLHREHLPDKSERGLIQLVDKEVALGWITTIKADGKQNLVPPASEIKLAIKPPNMHEVMKHASQKKKDAAEANAAKEGAADEPKKIEKKKEKKEVQRTRTSDKPVFETKDALKVRKTSDKKGELVSEPPDGILPKGSKVHIAMTETLSDKSEHALIQLVDDPKPLGWVQSKKADGESNLAACAVEQIAGAVRKVPATTKDKKKKQLEKPKVSDLTEAVLDFERAREVNRLMKPVLDKNGLVLHPPATKRRTDQKDASRHDEAPPLEVDNGVKLMFNLLQCPFKVVEGPDNVPESDTFQVYARNGKSVGKVKIPPQKGMDLDARLVFDNGWLDGEAYGLMHHSLQGQASVELYIRYQEEEVKKTVVLIASPWLAYACALGARFLVRKFGQTEGRIGTVKRVMNDDRVVMHIDGLDQNDVSQLITLDLRPDSVVVSTVVRHAIGTAIFFLHATSPTSSMCVDGMPKRPSTS